jgi:uncharacterized repeat protein (TIGR03803 family)
MQARKPMRVVLSAKSVACAVSQRTAHRVRCGATNAKRESGTLTTLHFFAGPDGCGPEAGLLQATDGNFYGTAGGGGANGCGTVFRITSSGILSTVHNFTGSDGSYPRDGLIQATDGNFYGTTFGGGANGDSTVFRLVLPARQRPRVFCPVTE